MEAGNIMAPKSKSRQTEMQTAFQRTCHSIPRATGIASPMQRITLASRPCGTCPDNTVTCHFFRNFVSGLLIKQGIQVVQQFRLHAFIEGVHVNVFTEIGFDTGYSHIQKLFQ